MAEPKYKRGEMVWFTDSEGRERYAEITTLPGYMNDDKYWLNTMGIFAHTTALEEHEIHTLSLRERINRIEAALNLD